MPRLHDNPEITSLIALYATFPDPFLKVSPLGQAIMRNGASPFTEAEQELIAAYVSMLNGCRYCHGIHAEVARGFGLAPELLEALDADLATAPIEARMGPVLALARQLTEAPARMTDAHAEAVRAAGWDDGAVVFTIATTAYFNMMNRLADGFGLAMTPEQAAVSARRLVEGGYTGVRNAAAARAGIDPQD